MIPVLSQVCSLHSDFGRDVRDYAAGQCRQIEVWLTKLETFLENHSLTEFHELLDEQQVTLPVASFQGGLLTSQGDARTVAWEHFEQRLSLCQQCGISVIVLAADIAAPLRQTDVDRAIASLQQAAELAAGYRVRVALEFQARAAFINNLQTAVAVVEDVGKANLGICLDAFHFYTGPSKYSDLQLLTNENLFHVQLSDLADVPREFATDSDRILPGEGDFDVAALIEQLRAVDYQGTIAIEVMNPRIWQIPPLQFGEIGTTALRMLLGLADDKIS